MALFSNTNFDSMEDLFVEQLEDIYDTEKRLTKALPDMAKAATDEKLRSAFESHLEETKDHVGRLEQVFKLVNRATSRALRDRRLRHAQELRPAARTSRCCRDSATYAG